MPPQQHLATADVPELRPDSSVGERVLVVTNVAAPYRMALLNRVWRRFARFSVAFQATSERGRSWDLRPATPFKAYFLQKHDLPLGGRHLVLNRGIKAVFDAEDPTLVVAGGFSIPVAHMAWLCARQGRRFVLMNDGTSRTDPTSGVEGGYRRWLVGMSVGAIGASSGSVRYFHSMGMASSRVARVQLTTDLEPYRSIGVDPQEVRTAKARFAIPGPAVCFVGQLIERKKPLEVLDAFRIARCTIPDLTLLIAGAGDQHGELLQRSADLPAGAVRILGHLDEKGVRDVLAASDLHLFPSVHEPYGLVVLESLAAGVPVVTTHCVGAAEDLVEHGVTGYYVTPGDVDGMGVCIVRHLRNRPAAERMRKACRDRALAFDLPGQAEAFVEAVKRFAAAPLRGGGELPQAGTGRRRLHVAYVTESLAPYRVPFIRAMQDRGVGVTVIEAGGGSGATSSTIEGLEIVRCRRSGFWRSDVIEACRHSGSDALLIEHGARHSFAWSLLLDRSTRVPRFLWSHGIENRERFSGRKTAASLGRDVQIRLSDGVVCYDRTTPEDLRRRYVGKPTGAAPNSTDGRPIAAAARGLMAQGRIPLRRDLGLPKPVYMIAVGRLVAGKKFDRLAAILELVRRDHPECGLLVVGDGPELARVQQTFASRGFGIGADVTFLGHVATVDGIARAFRASDVCVNPGYIGLAAVDSLFAGIPVVLANPGPAGPYHSPEWIYLRDSKGGLFAPSDSDQDLARCVSQYLREPEAARQALESACMAYAETVLGVEPMADGMVDFLVGSGRIPGVDRP